MKLKKGDNVLVISGKDRGRTGKILRSLPKEIRIVVEGLNLRAKHVRPRKRGEKGQVVKVPAPMDVSNVKLVCSKCSKPARVGYIIREKKKFRVCKKCKSEI